MTRIQVNRQLVQMKRSTGDIAVEIWLDGQHILGKVSKPHLPSRIESTIGDKSH